MSKKYCKTFAIEIFIIQTETFSLSEIEKIIPWKVLETSSWSLRGSLSKEYRKAKHNSEKNSHKVFKNEVYK